MIHESHQRLPLRRIVAQVQLRPDAERQADLAAFEIEGVLDDAPSWLKSGTLEQLREETYLELRVRLCAETWTGQLVHADSSFDVSIPRARPSAEIRHRIRPSRRATSRQDGSPAVTWRLGSRGLTLMEHINGMLGRDPRLHRPPILAWADLTTALNRASMDIAENALIALPLDIELDDAVEIALWSSRW